MPWTMHPWADASLARGVPDRCVLTLDRIEVLVIISHFGLGVHCPRAPLLQRTPRPRGASSKGSLLQKTHRPGDASSEGRLLQRTPSPRDASSEGRLLQRTPPLWDDASSRGLGRNNIAPFLLARTVSLNAFRVKRNCPVFLRLKKKKILLK